MSSWMKFLPVLLLLAPRVNGCGTEPVDQDGDAWYACQPEDVQGECDCDDNAADTHPGAAERCDLQDNDCDAQIDEGYAGLDCELAASIPDYVPAQILLGHDNVLYLLSPENDRIFRWSLEQGFHLPPIETGPQPQYLSYSATSHRLYLAYDDGALTQIDLAGPLVEAPFATLSGVPQGLATAGSYVFAVDNASSWVSYFTFTAQGQQVSTLDNRNYSLEYVFSQANDRMYFLKQSSPSDLAYEDIAPDSGLFTGHGESPYHGAYEISFPIRVSPDGDRVLLGSGDIYNGHDITLVNSLPIVLEDAAWLPDSLLTLRDPGDGSTLLEQWTGRYQLYNTATFAGTPLRVFSSGDAYVVVTEYAGQPSFYRYLPTDDRDEDGAKNPDDAFPSDPAASQDSDGDGYPDAWNAGHDQGDSTTGLTLDAFPDDSACQLESQGKNGVCDISGNIPFYQPTQVVLGGDVIYLLSAEQDRVFRWSISQARDLNPLVVGPAPEQMTYSSVNNHLYLAYFEDGRITQIDLAASSPKEQPFATMPTNARGLASAGPYVFGVDNSGSDMSHYIYAPDGTLISSFDMNYYSKEYIWSEANGRMYFLQDGISPNDVNYQDIDPATGNITGEGESPYHGEYEVVHPLRVSGDGSAVILGTGDLYDGHSLIYLGSIQTLITDAAWLDSGVLLTMRESSSGRTSLEQWGQDYQLIKSSSIVGSPVRVFQSGQGVVVVTEVAGKPAFQGYRP